MRQRTPPQFAAKLQHLRAFVNTLPRFFLINRCFVATHGPLLLKGLGNEFEVVDDVDVLRALGLALATLDTLASLAVLLADQVIIEFAITLLFRELL